MSTTNIDHDEIHKFSAIQEDWWNPDGQCAPLHHINPLRLVFIKQHAELKNQKILDVGCGGGILSEALAQAGADVTGIDLSQSALETAQKHQDNLNINYLYISVE